MPPPLSKDPPRILLIFGSPGVGKTGLLEDLTQKLHNQTKAKLRGFFVKSVQFSTKMHGNIGWDVHSLTGEYIPFARAYDIPGMPKVGRCTVDTTAFEKVALPSMSLNDDDESGLKTVYLIDGIAEMELQSYAYTNQLKKLLDSSDIVICSVRTCPFHSVTYKRVMEDISGLPGSKSFTLTPSNKANVSIELLMAVKTALGLSRGHDEREGGPADRGLLQGINDRRHDDPEDTFSTHSESNSEYGSGRTGSEHVHNVPSVELRLDGIPREGNSLNVVVLFNDMVIEHEIKGIRIEWFRGNSIQSRYNNQRTYPLTDMDVGHTILCRFFPFAAPEYGTTVFTRSAPIQAGPPKVLDLKIEGGNKPVVGNTLRCTFRYNGSTVIQWLRVPATSDGPEIKIGGNHSEYEPIMDDIGYLIKAVVTPVPEKPNQLVSPPVERTTLLTVKPGGSSLRITVVRGGDFRSPGGFNRPDPQLELVLQHRDGRKQKFRTTTKHQSDDCEWIEDFNFNSKSDMDTLTVNLYDNSIEPVGTTNTTLDALDLPWDSPIERLFTLNSTVNRHDRVGKVLLAFNKTYPQASGNRSRGSSVSSDSKSPRPSQQPLDPLSGHEGSIRDLHFEGELAVKSTLTAVCQCQGPLTYNWYRQSENGDEVELHEQSSTLLLSPKDYNHYIRLKVSELGANNERIGCMEIKTDRKVVAAMAQIMKCRLTGEPEEGQELILELEIDYGGVEGECAIEWSRGGEAVPEKTGEKRYLLGPQDINKKIEVCCIPLTADGAEGNQERCESSRIRPLVPLATNVNVSGPACPGKVIYASYTYRGGSEGETICEWKTSRNGREWKKVYSSVKNRNWRDGQDGGYLVSPDDLLGHLKCTITPVKSGGTKGDPVDSGMLSVTMDPNHRQVMKDLICKQENKVTLASSEANYTLLCSYKKVEVTQGNKTIQKQEWVPNMTISYSSEGPNFKGIELALPKASFKGKCEDPELVVMCFRAFYGMSLKEISYELFPEKKLYDEWRKGNIAKAYQEKLKGKTKGDKVMSLVDGQLQRRVNLGAPEGLSLALSQSRDVLVSLMGD